jgi:predicted nucleic acid-binding protein
VTRVFLDANVLFSAAWRANAGLTRLWELPELQLVTSPYAAAEAERNLARKRPDAMDRLVVLLSRLEVTNAFCLLDDGHGLPPKDEPILAAAVASQCQVLLTGDIADFGHALGRTLQGVRILTAAMLLAELALPPK